MKILYSENALKDMGWFRRYYSKVFPEGKGSARASLLRTEALIAENPFVGHPTAQGAETREFPVLRTPFSMLYRVKANRIEILRVLDHRAER
jgi:toxin ParE1/3/4